MRIIRKTIAILILLTCMLIASTLAIAYYFGDEIKALVVSNLNKNLKTEVEVKQVEFSVWENFPSASVVFTDVVIHAVHAKNDTLISAQKLSAKFNLIQILKNNYTLSGLKISDGSCNLVVDNSSRANYIFWKTDSTSSSNFSIALEEVEIENVVFSYADYSKDVEVKFLIEETKLSGTLGASNYKLSINSVFKNSNFRFGELSLFENRTIFIATLAEVNSEGSSISFSDANLGVDAMNLKLDGSYHYGDKSRIDLTVASSNTDLGKAVDLLPNPVRKNLARFKLKGQAEFKGSVSGEISAISNPAYQFDFSITSGRIEDKQTDLKFSNCKLNGSITNGAESRLSTTVLSLNSFSTQLKQGKLEGKMRIENFLAPSYEYQGNITFDLGEAADLFNWKLVESPAGSISASLDLSGKLTEVGKYSLQDWKNSKIRGEAKLSQLGFKYQGKPQRYSKINGKLKFTNNSIRVDQLKGSIDDTELTISGSFNNLIAFLLEEQQPLFVDAAVSSPQLDLASILASNEQRSTKKQDYKLEISPRLTIFLAAEVEELKFHKLSINQLKSSIVVKDERIDIRDIMFKADGGTVSGDLFIREKENNKLSIITKADLNQVDIKRLFESFDNFGQQTLRANHLAGKCDATIHFSSNWSKQLEIEQESIEAEADVSIYNGVLTTFKPLESLSRFVELDELREVKFKTVHNQILIKNEKILLPQFDINSSAINLKLAGTHSFKNEIDYHMTIDLNEVLGRKAKKPKNNEFGYVEDDGLGRTKLFLKMTGTVDNPEISYDSDKLKSNIKEKFKQEKRTVKSLLKEEFGWFKNDSTLKSLDSKKAASSPFQVEIDSSYIKKKESDSLISNKDKSERKSRFGKFLDKIAQPNEEEFVDPIEN